MTLRRGSVVFMSAVGDRGDSHSHDVEVTQTGSALAGLEMSQHPHLAVCVSGASQHGQQCGEAACHLSRMSADSALQRLPHLPDSHPAGEGLR